jgi:hypothetical protein
LAVSADGRAVAWLHGYPSAQNIQLAWLDYADQSRWRSTPASYVTTSAPSSATSFIFLGRSTLVGYGGSRGLWIRRTSRGRWREELSSWLVTAVAGANGRLWLVAQRCALDRRCRSQVLTSEQSLRHFHRPTREPGGPPSILRLVVTGDIAAVVRQPWRDGEHLWVTTDEGRSWVRHSLPCADADSAGPPLGAAAGTLWVTCLTGRGDPSPCCGLMSTYRSTDDGRSWVRMTRPGAGVYDLVVDAMTATAAWGQTSTSDGKTSIYLTRDGGAHWSRPRAPWERSPQKVSVSYLTFAAQSPTTASMLVQSINDAGTTFTVYRTTDRGRTWTPTSLPVAPNLPTAAWQSPRGRR